MTFSDAGFLGILMVKLDLFRIPSSFDKELRSQKILRVNTVCHILSVFSDEDQAFPSGFENPDGICFLFLHKKFISFDEELRSPKILRVSTIRKHHLILFSDEGQAIASGFESEDS